MKKILDEVYREQRCDSLYRRLHTLIGAGGAEGSIDASNILKPALARGEIKLSGRLRLMNIKNISKKMQP